MNNFQKIRSHLEYGHKVDVATKDGYKAVFIGIWEDIGEVLRTVYFITSTGLKFQANSLTCGDFTSITPIPHHYKKLEVGTKVDVLPEAKEKLGLISGVEVTQLNPWRVYGYADGDTQVHLRPEPINHAMKIKLDLEDIYVPLWAITSHVEGEEKTNTLREVSQKLLKTVEDYKLISDGSGFSTTLTAGAKTYKVLITEV